MGGDGGVIATQRKFVRGAKDSNYADKVVDCQNMKSNQRLRSRICLQSALVGDLVWMSSRLTSIRGWLCLSHISITFSSLFYFSRVRVLTSSPLLQLFSSPLWSFHYLHILLFLEFP
jgi:hypothetical protein